MPTEKFELCHHGKILIVEAARLDDLERKQVAEVKILRSRLESLEQSVRDVQIARVRLGSLLQEAVTGTSNVGVCLDGSRWRFHWSPPGDEQQFFYAAVPESE